MQRQRRTPPSERALARRFAGWHGVLSLDQLLDFGLGRGAVDYRLRVGRLHRVHRGVYSLVPPGQLSRAGRWLAAVRACGPDALLGEGFALAHYALLREPPAGSVTVIVPAGRDPRPAGVRVRRSRTLCAADRWIYNRIPVTTLERSLIDFADRADRRAVEGVADQAEVRGLLRLDRLAAAVRANAGRCGAAVVGRLVEDYQFGRDLTESELEDEFLRFCDRERLRRPESQVWIGPYRVDFLWREPRLAVETDSWRFHGGRAAWENDSKRDIQLKLRGITVARLTWRRIRREPDQVAAELLALAGDVLRS